MIDKLKNWYALLAEREQRMVLFGAIAAGVLLLIAAVLPLERAVAGAAQRVERKQADLAWMRQMAPALALAPQGAPATQESLIVLVDRSAREAGLGQSLTGSQPSGNGALRTQFEKADFNVLVAWIAALSQQYGVQAESATFDGTDAPGIVNAAIVVRAR